MATTRKETIKAPTKREVSDASRELRAGHPSGGRTMADKSVAVRQGVSKPSGGKKRVGQGPPLAEAPFTDD